MGTQTGLVYPVWIEGTLERGLQLMSPVQSARKSEAGIPQTAESDSGFSATDDFAIRRLK